MVVKYNECLKCTKRYVGCHSNCETYKTFRTKLDKLKETKQQSKYIDTLHMTKKSRGRK